MSHKFTYAYRMSASSLNLSLSTYTTSTVKRDACPLCCEDFKKCGSDTVEADKGIEDFKKLPDADKGTE